MKTGVIQLVQSDGPMGPQTTMVVGDTAVVGVDGISIGSDDRGQFMDIRVRSYLLGSTSPEPEPDPMPEVAKKPKRVERGMTLEDIEGPGNDVAMGS